MINFELARADEPAGIMRDLLCEALFVFQRHQRPPQEFFEECYRGLQEQGLAGGLQIMWLRLAIKPIAVTPARHDSLAGLLRAILYGEAPVECAVTDEHREMIVRFFVQHAQMVIDADNQRRAAICGWQFSMPQWR